MNPIKYAAVNIIETALRGFPIPCKTGIVKIGNPDRKSPVFLTCNYHLTVERVKKCLHGIDCYLLVANSRGINVWCASAGGYFTNHSVISILKTSEIEGLVDHRTVVLPQLAATGIEARVIQKKTGWKVIWGPVYADDIPVYVKRKFKKTRAMRGVRFPTVQRVEMAVMWAFPFSVITGLITLALWRELFLPLTGLIWGLPLLIFLSFPCYSKWLDPKKRRAGFNKYTGLFDFSRIPLLLWGVFIGFLTLSSILTNTFTGDSIFRWGLTSFIIVLLISIDLMGSTPVYKSGLHEDRFLKVVLDEKRCKGAGFCEQVCPRNCYEVDRNLHIATMPGADKCVQCGACIVQCPFDALYFKSPKDEIMQPETIRRFKLNLIGKRLVKVEGK